MNTPQDPAGSRLAPTTGSEIGRAYTKEEAKDALLNHIRELVEYWSRVDRQDEKEKLSGLAFSILNIFDGTTVVFPAMDIVLRPHESDEQFCRENGENWWPDGLVVNDDATLHEEFYSPNAQGDSRLPDGAPAAGGSAGRFAAGVTAGSR